MHCKTIQPNIPDFARGVLDPMLARNIENHLLHCPACARLRDELLPCFTLLDDVSASAMLQRPGPDFLVAVNRKLDAPKQRWVPGSLFVQVGIPSTVCLVLVLLTFLASPFRGVLPQTMFDDAKIQSIVESMDTTQLAQLSDELDAGNRLIGMHSVPDVSPSASDASIGAPASVFSDLSYHELISGSSAYLSSDDIVDIASSAPSESFSFSAQ